MDGGDLHAVFFLAVFRQESGIVRAEFFVNETEFPNQLGQDLLPQCRVPVDPVKIRVLFFRKPAKFRRAVNRSAGRGQLVGKAKHIPEIDVGGNGDQHIIAGEGVQIHPDEGFPRAPLCAGRNQGNAAGGSGILKGFKARAAHIFRGGDRIAQPGKERRMSAFQLVIERICLVPSGGSCLGKLLQKGFILLLGKEFGRMLPVDADGVPSFCNACYRGSFQIPQAGSLIFFAALSLAEHTARHAAGDCVAQVGSLAEPFQRRLVVRHFL